MRSSAGGTVGGRVDAVGVAGSDIDEEEERRKLQETPDGGAKEEKEGEENKETTKAAKDEASRDAPVAAGNDTSDVAKPMAPTTPTGGTMKSEQVAAPVVENAS
ncbi:PREDICTED: uncharacterized protein LOC106816328 [Priapulus caudatus]|uniref:Uncharacterized protein LOC106816328 n=1 Tax=Priapulus caudatus TaxID=37621 RepID=A0ABM1EW24_PRICU|nr:PREDICTED: uncharacterized protein LOC106816328 [Priapulus caudatus]